MDEPVKLLDVVALTEDIAAHGLRRGQVGTVVEFLPDDAFEVEFADANGRTYAMFPCRREQFMRLRYEPTRAAG